MRLKIIIIFFLVSQKFSYSDAHGCAAVLFSYDFSVFSGGKNFAKIEGNLARRGEVFAFAVAIPFFRLLKEWQQSGVIARSPEDSSVNAEDSSADAKTLQQAPLRQDGLERQRSEHFFTRRSPFMRSG